jgi:hypothetical protein
VALRSYIADVKTLVAAGVKKECSCDATETTDGVAGGASINKLRLKNLQTWLACENPLGYKDKAYEHLLRCIIPDPCLYSDGLPNTSKEKLSVHEFALRICQMSRPDAPASVVAPLISTAPSTTVFRIAFAHMLKYAPPDSPAAAELFVQQSYVVAANHLHIQHIPWHVVPAGTRGRPSRKPVHGSWVNLGKSTSSADKLSVGRLKHRPTDLAAEASKKAQASDARAPWAVESITLQSLPDYFARDSLPDEFGIHNIACSGDPLLQEIHAIALLAGIYFSQILPDMFWDPKDKPHLSQLVDERSTTYAVRHLPWKPNKGTRKGSTWRSQFIAMVPAYIIAVYERDSPLRAYLTKKKAFPQQWNAKNSAKGIGSLNLVRLGLAKARSSRIFKGGAPLADWVLLTTEELSSKHQELMGLLRDPQYGPFKIAVSFFGLDKAEELGASTGTYTNHPSMASIAIKKRPLPDTDDDDDDDEVDILEHKRARH